MTDNKNNVEDKNKAPEQFQNHAVVLQIPLIIVDFSVCEKEFSNIRNDCENQMKMIEEAMVQFQNEVKAELEKAEAEGKNTQLERNTSKISQSSPLVESVGDKDILKLRFSMGKFDSSEVEIKVENGVLMIKANHEETTDNKKVHKEFMYNFILPEGVVVDSITSTLSQDGILTVEAPIKPEATK